MFWENETRSVHARLLPLTDAAEWQEVAYIMHGTVGNMTRDVALNSRWHMINDKLEVCGILRTWSITVADESGVVTQCCFIQAQGVTDVLL